MGSDDTPVIWAFTSSTLISFSTDLISRQCVIEHAIKNELRSQKRPQQ